MADTPDLGSYRRDFPLLINTPHLVYLDSTATSLKPQPVIDALMAYYTEYSANVFRGVYELSEKATANYEESRKKIAAFIGAKNEKEIIFVRGATEAINLFMYAWGKPHIRRGDTLATTIMEHHSNFVPWQQLALQVGAKLTIMDVDEEGRLKTQDSQLDKIISLKTKLLAITHVSNVLGTINPIKEIIKNVKKINPHIIVIVDGAQAVPHLPVDVADLGCDAYVFSGHKMLGPTGIGVLWAKEEILEEMVPFHFGGEMIREVHANQTIFKDPPHKFEAGTPHIAGAIGLGAAVDYLCTIGMEHIRKHEEDLIAYALEQLDTMKHVTVYGPKKASEKSGVVAFNISDSKGKIIHGHDVAQILNQDAVCIRSGHHCAMPLHEYLGLAGSARASFYLYTTKSDIDRLIMGIDKVAHIFE